MKKSMWIICSSLFQLIFILSLQKYSIEYYIEIFIHTTFIECAIGNSVELQLNMT